jgi:hypothetical protein
MIRAERSEDMIVARTQTKRASSKDLALFYLPLGAKETI